MTTASTPSDWGPAGRVCMITGATSGIGRATAFKLASLGAELVLVGRSERTLRLTARAIGRATVGARLKTIRADLSAQADVRLLARRVLDEVPRLDVLINNAAVVTMQRELTVDGIERQLAVNHLAPFLLTNLLIERLASSAPSRVVIVASQLERNGTIELNDLQGQLRYDSGRAYSQSKLANILFANELARRVGHRGIAVISLHPGVYTTPLLHKLYNWSAVITRLRGRGVPGPEGGGGVLAHAVSAPEFVGATGIYLQKDIVSLPSEQARDPVLAHNLWEASARLTGLGE